MTDNVIITICIIISSFMAGTFVGNLYSFKSIIKILKEYKNIDKEQEE